MPEAMPIATDLPLTAGVRLKSWSTSPYYGYKPPQLKAEQEVEVQRFLSGLNNGNSRASSNAHRNRSLSRDRELRVEPWRPTGYQGYRGSGRQLPRSKDALQSRARHEHGPRYGSKERAVRSPRSKPVNRNYDEADAAVSESSFFRTNDGKVGVYMKIERKI